ncbi:unnamed protein product [Trichobilharzia szidati]|nr:unnamed protein product [Trichobilharzia szidati]
MLLVIGFSTRYAQETPCSCSPGCPNCRNCKGCPGCPRFLDPFPGTATCSYKK